MANPQKENGYTAIANELFEAIIAFRIPGEIRQVFDAILRKTYGYNKKEDAIANSQLVLLTGMKKGNVSRSLSRLIVSKLVIKTDNSYGSGNLLKINKDYSQWIPFVIKSDNKKKLSKRKPKLSKQITEVIQNDNKPLSELMDTKDKTILKDTIQKTDKNAYAFLEGEQWNELIDSFEPVNPMYTSFYRMKTQRAALQEIVKAIGYEKTLWLIRHLRQATCKPYAPRITKPTQLRDKLGELQTFWEQEKQKLNITNNKGRGLA